jgi:hypothetical protein
MRISKSISPLRFSLILSAAVAASSGAAFAQSRPTPLLSTPADIQSQYEAEVARCNAGRSGQDLQTCLKEAGAAKAEAQKGNLSDTGGYQQNALDRCQRLPPSQRSDCLLLMQSNTPTEGSVPEGGVLRERTIIIRGGVETPAPVAAPAAPRAPAMPGSTVIPVPRAPQPPMPAPGGVTTSPVQ